MLLKRPFMEGKNTKRPLLAISYLPGAHEAICFLVVFKIFLRTVELLTLEAN